MKTTLTDRAVKAMRTKRMTRAEAYELVGKRTGEGYYQAELQYIWDNEPDLPVQAIMSFGFTRGEAMRLWNARKSQDDPFAGRTFHFLIANERSACGARQSKKAAFTVDMNSVNCPKCNVWLQFKKPHYENDAD